MSTCIHYYLIFDKEIKYTCEQRVFSTYGAGKTGYSHAEEKI